MTKEEISKLNNAIEKVSFHLDEMSEIALESYGKSNAEIFCAQKMLLNDTGFYVRICSHIERGLSASDAVEISAKEMVDNFNSIEDEYLQAKASDIEDIAKRLKNVINGHALKYIENSSLYSGIVSGDELTVSDILLLEKKGINRIVFNETSEFSHRVIIAKARGFEVLCTSNKRDVISEIAKSADIEKKSFLRTEFLYMNRDVLPDISEQIEVYSDFVSSNKNSFPIIRIFDLGSDKISDAINRSEDREFLCANRGVRKALRNREELKKQLYSIIRAASDLEIETGILIPMVATKTELEKIRTLIDDEINTIALETSRDSDSINNLIKLGAMIETPAACMISDDLAVLCDYYMIGLNDLLQFTYGCDRNSRELEAIYDENKDAVLNLIDIVKKSAASENITVSVCEATSM